MEQQMKKRGFARRAAFGIGKAWAYSLGITNLARTGQRIWGRLDAGANYVQRKLADGPQNYRHESFNEAVDRLGLDDAHLVRQARIFRLYAMWYFAATMVATGWLAYVPFTGHPVNAFFMALGAIALAGSQWLTFHFRYCQIRDRELFSFTPWVLSPGRW